MTEYIDQSAVAISIASIRAQNDGAEMAVTAVIENGTARDVRKFVILTEQYCSLKPVKGISSTILMSMPSRLAIDRAVKPFFARILAARFWSGVM